MSHSSLWTPQSLALLLSPLPEFSESNVAHSIKIDVLRGAVSTHFSHSSPMRFQHKRPHSEVAEDITQILMDGPIQILPVWQQFGSYGKP